MVTNLHSKTAPGKSHPACSAICAGGARGVTGPAATAVMGGFRGGSTPRENLRGHWSRSSRGCPLVRGRWSRVCAGHLQMSWASQSETGPPAGLHLYATLPGASALALQDPNQGLGSVIWSPEPGLNNTLLPRGVPRIYTCFSLPAVEANTPKTDGHSLHSVLGA